MRDQSCVKLRLKDFSQHGVCTEKGGEGVQNTHWQGAAEGDVWHTRVLFSATLEKCHLWRVACEQYPMRKRVERLMPELEGQFLASLVRLAWKPPWSPGASEVV